MRLNLPRYLLSYLIGAAALAYLWLNVALGGQPPRGGLRTIHHTALRHAHE
jgi:hypothetical protein